MVNRKKYYNYLFISVIIIVFITVFITIFISGCSNNFDENSDPNAYNKGDNYELGQSKDYKSNVGNKDNQSKENQLTETQLKKKQYLDVPLIEQNPELKYGCEITSLTMVLQYAGFNVDKMTLAKQLEKDNDRLIKSNSGDIVKWGDPSEGFVGDITGKSAGYAVFDQPIEDLMRKYLGDRTLNLTGDSFDGIYRQLSDGKPVIVWTTGDYRLPDRWEAWQHGNEKIKTPLDLHAVVLVGYDSEYLYLNDPLSGEKAAQVKKEVFIESWKALKKRALSYR